MELDIGRQAGSRARVDIDGDLTPGADVAAELAIPGPELEDSRIRGHVTLEEP
jgi:hypothetical protein